jgi:anti-sigma-K factor RskA
MSIEEYISSGMIELYAMGVLPPAEQAEVEAMLKKHPVLQQEFEQIQLSLETFAQANAITPPAHLKEKIKTQIEFTPGQKQTSANTNPQGLRIIRNYQYAVAASVTLLLVSSALTYYYKTQYTNSRNEIAQLTSQQNLLSDQLEKASLNSNKLSEEMAILKNPDIKMVAMKGMPASPDAMAIVYWNPLTKEAFVNVKNLPAPAEGEQYQLWALVDGQPVDAGVFELNSDSLQKVKNVDAAQTFAVTLEKRGGSPTPTLEKLTVIGNI